MRSISLFFRSVAKSLLLITSLTFFGISAQAQDPSAGAALFKQKCTACHRLDRNSIGPALKGVHERHDEEWLMKWIKNSQAMVAAGDPAAVKVFNDFNKVAMPAFPELKDEDIANILAYVKEGDKPAAGEAAAAGAGAAQAEEGVSNFMIIGLIAVVIIAFLVLMV
ncbi:MAG TPA: cytochrome c, partial [Sphingobacteriaceae bacterium]